MKDNLLAQNPTGLGTIGGEGLGPFGKSVVDPGTAVASVISLIIGFITIIAGIFFLVQLIIGSLLWIASAGDKNKLQSAQDRMTNAFIGLVIVVAAYAITSIVGSVLGLPNILNPKATIDLLPKL